jgi:hypothetical protein
MEPKGLFPHLQEPATCPYPEPDQSSPCPHVPLLNIVLPSTPGCPSLRFPYQNPVCTSPIPHTCYISCPSHSSRFDYPEIFGKEYRLVSSTLYSFSPLPCYLIPLRPKYSPQHPILRHPQPTFPNQYERLSFMAVQNNRKHYS